MVYTIKVKLVCFMQDSLGNRGSHRPLEDDPRYPAAHYTLDLRSYIPQTKHGTEMSLTQNGAKPKPSGILHLQEEVVLGPQSNAMVLQKITPSQNLWLLKGPLRLI